MEAEAGLPHGERRGDDDAGAPLERELDGPKALRPGGGKPRARRLQVAERELRERRLALGGLIGDVKDVGA